MPAPRDVGVSDKKPSGTGTVAECIVEEGCNEIINHHRCPPLPQFPTIEGQDRIRWDSLRRGMYIPPSSMDHR